MSPLFAIKVFCLFATISLAHGFLIYPRLGMEKFVDDKTNDNDNRFKPSLKIEKQREISEESSSDEAIDKIFDKADSNSDNNLSMDEYLHSDPLYTMLKLNEFIKLKMDEFKRFDTNEDGLISRKEFHAYLQSELESTNNLKAEYFGQLFQDFDDNFDLKFDIEELRRILAVRFLVKTKSEQTFQRLFREFDTNSDGLLDLNEYLKVDQNLPFEEFRPLTSAEITAQQKDEDERRKTVESDASADSDPQNESSTTKSEE